jgi:hypothetical protein
MRSLYFDWFGHTQGASLGFGDLLKTTVFFWRDFHSDQFTRPWGRIWWSVGAGRRGEACEQTYKWTFIHLFPTLVWDGRESDTYMKLCGILRLTFTPYHRCCRITVECCFISKRKQMWTQFLSNINKLWQCTFNVDRTSLHIRQRSTFIWISEYYFFLLDCAPPRQSSSIVHVRGGGTTVRLSLQQPCCACLFSFVSPQYCRVHRCAGIAIKSGIAITSFGLRPSPLGQVLHLKKIAFRVPFQSDKF